MNEPRNQRNPSDVMEPNHVLPDGKTPAEPQPWAGGFADGELYRKQGPDSGLNAIIGKWPGDETDDEVFAMLEDIS